MFLAIDCGKYNTKVAGYDNGDLIKPFKFRTKMDPGFIEDDYIERGTMIIQIGEETYKIGNGAAHEAEMETSKKSEIHRICTLTGIALAMAQTGKTSAEIDIAIGIPYMMINNPRDRMSYKDYILGEEGTEYSVALKTSGNLPAETYTFKINKRFVYPEGIGVLYEFPEQLDGPVGIIDIGNLNTNCLYVNSFIPISDGCYTTEQGGQVLITGLAQELSAELGARVDVNLAASTLLKSGEARALHPKNGDKTIIENSRKIIERYVKDYVNTIKTRCDTHHWPMNFINIVVIGGTAQLITEELKEIFGDNIFIPSEPEFVNVNGFLRRLCAECGVDIDEER